MAFAPAAPLKWGNAELQPATDFTAASVPIYRHSSRRRPRPRPIVVTARLTRRAFLSQALVVALAPLLRRPARAEYNAEPDGLETDLYSQSSARGGATGLGLRPPISGDDHVRPQSQKSRIPSEVPDPRVRMQIFERQATRHYAIDSENDEEQGQAESSHGTVRVRVTKERDKLSERNAESDKRAYEDLRAYDTVEGLNDADEDGPVPIDYVDAVTIRRDELLSDSFAEFLKSSAATAGVFVTVASLIALAERNSISRRDAIPLQYDRKRIARYCLTRPERVIMRISKYAIEIMRYASIVAVDAFLDGIRAGGRAAKRARRKRRARNLRECITRLGPGLIKLGQAAATRPDLFGETFTSELQLLQDSLFQGFQSKEAFELIRDELQAPLKSIFAYIEPKPVAGASLGMVFKAWLVEKAKDESSVESVANEQVVPSSELEVDRLSIGNVNISAETTSAEKREQSDSAYMPRVRFQQERNKVFQWRWKRPPELFLKTRQEVAIKVQRPHVAELMTLDFFIVRGIAVVIARILNIRTDLGDAVDEYASSVFEELNYIKEADNMQRFREMYGATPGLYIPEVYPVYSSRRVLVVEWIDGIRLTDKRARVRAQDIGIVEIGIRSALDQCLSGGFMHCDLHNGNILRLKQDLTKLAFIDFGICASIPEYTRQCTVCALLHLIHHDYAALADTFAGMSLMRAVDLEKELPLLSEALGKALESGRDEKTVDDEANRQARGPAVKLSGPVVAEQSSTKAFVKEDIAMQQNAPIFSRDDANLKENQVSQPASDDSAESHSSDSMYSELDNEFVEDVYENLPAVSKFTFIGVAEKLIRLSGQFPLVFRDYFLSNIKSLAMLEVRGQCLRLWREAWQLLARALPCMSLSENSS